MLSLRWLLVLAAVCCAVAVVFEIGSAALAEHRRLSPDVASRADFLAKYGHLVGEYLFLVEVVEESRGIVAVGDWLPALDFAWAQSSIMNTANSMARWLSNNFLARLLSPQTFGEKAMLLGCIIVFVYAGAAVYMHHQKIAFVERRFGGGDGGAPSATTKRSHKHTDVAEMAKVLYDVTVQ